MSTKEKLIERIVGINDEALLLELMLLIDLETATKDIYILSEEEDEALTKTMEASDRGEIYSNEEAKRIIDEWFKKK